MQLRLAATLGDAQLSGYFIMCVPFKAVEHKDRSCPVRQFGNRLLETNSLIAAFPVTSLGDVIYIEAVKEWFLLSEVAERNIGCNSIQPAAEGAVTTKTAQFSPRLNEGFLGQVFCYIPVFAEANTKRKEAAHMQFVKLLVGSIIIFLCTLNQQSFIDRWLRGLFSFRYQVPEPL
jgi:hypothetical protein